MRLYFLLLLAFLPLSGKEPVFTDPLTGFVWEDRRENRDLALNWHDAVAYCDELDLAGKSDWMLPDEEVLVSLVDMGRPEGRRINQGIVFYRAARYWTSTTYAFNAPEAWNVDFYRGISWSDDKEELRFVRCVRCDDMAECYGKLRGEW